MAIDLAFIDSKTEKRFKEFVSGDKEVGGVLFWKFSQINDMHWKRHQAIFDAKSFGIITDWLVCPNVSNIPDREYTVSDLKQFIGIAEQTANSRGVLHMHFHSHPNGRWMSSEGDQQHWLKHWVEYNYFVRGAIACIDRRDGELCVKCHSATIEKGQPEIEFTVGHFLSRKYINSRIRRYDREHPAKASAA